MRRTVAAFVFLIGLLSAGPAAAGPEEDATAVRRNIEQTFNAKNWDGLIGLYTGAFQYWGVGKSELIVSPDALRAYFSSLSPDLKIEMGEHSVIQIAPDTLLSAGFAVVTSSNRSNPPAVLRLTIVMANVDGRWLIAQYHASLMPKA